MVRRLSRSRIYSSPLDLSESLVGLEREDREQEKGMERQRAKEQSTTKWERKQLHSSR